VKKICASCQPDGTKVSPHSTGVQLLRGTKPYPFGWYFIPPFLDKGKMVHRFSEIFP